jgi:Tfp pilus assembly protein PilO
MSYWDTVYRFLTILAVILIVVLGITFFIPKCRTIADYKTKREALQEENRQKAAAIQELKRKQEAMLNDPEFIRRTARESGMVGAEEVVFKFTNSTTRITTNIHN